MDGASCLDSPEIQTPAEEKWNSITHGVGALLSAGTLALLVTLSSVRGSALQVVTVTLFGVSLVMMYLVSACYHACRHPRHKIRLQVLDHLMIYALIAGTYTPFLLVRLGGGRGDGRVHGAGRTEGRVESERERGNEHDRGDREAPGFSGGLWRGVRLGTAQVRGSAFHEVLEGLLARFGRQRAARDVGLDLLALRAEHLEVHVLLRGRGERAGTQQGHDHERDGDRHHQRREDPEDQHGGSVIPCGIVTIGVTRIIPDGTFRPG